MGIRYSKSLKRRRLFFELYEQRTLLAADHFGTNPLQPLDVSRDGIVSALHALQVINALNFASAQSSSANPADSVGSIIHVSNDGIGTAIDALRVINALNLGQPIIAATLPNDSAINGLTNLDLLTNDYGIDLSVRVAALGDRSVGIRLVEAMRREELIVAEHMP